MRTRTWRFYRNALEIYTYILLYTDPFCSAFNAELINVNNTTRFTNYECQSHCIAVQHVPI